MPNFQTYSKRASLGSESALKDRTFNREVKGSYNKEVVRNLISNHKAEAIIETSSLKESPDTKKIQVAFSSKLNVGDLIFWERLNSNWLITYQRTTEKNHFVGDIMLAKYRIHWRSENGKNFSQWACVRNQSSGINSLGQTAYFEIISGTLELVMPRTEGTEHLKRKKRIKINGRVYEINGVNDTNLENIVIFYLDERPGNEDLDSNDIPYANVELNIDILTSLDQIDSAHLNSNVLLNIETHKDGRKIDDTYEIMCTNCSYKGQDLIFDSLGTAKISIKSANTENTKELFVEISEEEKESISIIGNSTVKNMLSYTYKTNNDMPVEWTLKGIDGEVLNPAVSKIKKQSGEEVEIEIGPTLGEFVIEAKKGGLKVSKRIKITGLY